MSVNIKQNLEVEKSIFVEIMLEMYFSLSQHAQYLAYFIKNTEPSQLIINVQCVLVFMAEIVKLVADTLIA